MAFSPGAGPSRAVSKSGNPGAGVKAGGVAVGVDAGAGVSVGVTVTIGLGVSVGIGVSVEGGTTVGVGVTWHPARARSRIKDGIAIRRGGDQVLRRDWFGVS